MLRRIHSVKRNAWILLGLSLLFSMALMYFRATDSISPKLFLYVLQPVLALLLGAIAFHLIRGTPDRTRRRVEKAYIVASVLAVWFVLYFLSGLMTTYVKNTLLVTPMGVVLNIFGYGMFALFAEYTRHTLMQLAGRKNIIWFGALVTLIFAASQLNIASLSMIHTPEQFVKFAISDIVPIVASNLLLTYLAVSAGLPAMLVYRCTILAVTLLVPILPKHDWYMLGVSSLLLALAVYIVIDRSQQSTTPQHRKHRHHINGAVNLLFIITMAALALFMTGVFNYKPVVIVSNSMQPVYSRGAVVIVHMGATTMDIKSGAIIQYRHKQTGQEITHRVVEILQAADGSGKRVFITKGDNNQSQDVPVEESQVTGVVEATVPYIGYPTIWLRSLL